MSGVYIKGMEMPTSCRACMYSRTDIRNVDWCVLTKEDLPCDCPLVPVPPHGDLIDRKQLIKSDHQHYEYMSDEFYVTVRDIENALTIIPAEEESDA